MNRLGREDFPWPQNDSGWRQEVRRRKLRMTDFSIHNLTATQSASKMDDVQYLALRILWKREMHMGRASIEKILGDFYTKARSNLSDYERFIHYCEAVSKQGAYGAEGMDPSLGEFGQVLMDQLEVHARAWKDGPSENKVLFRSSPSPAVTRSRTYAERNRQRPPTPQQVLYQQQIELYGSPGSGTGRRRQSPGSSTSSSSSETNDVPLSPPSAEELRLRYPKTNDEEIVNVALLNFLKAFNVFAYSPARWTNARAAFFVDMQNDKSYEARTDGCLRGFRTRLTRAIVEVKAEMRYNNLQAVSRQEGAQMAAWVYTESLEGGDWESEGKFQRFIISQDRHEVYLTFASYEPNYVLYLRGELAEGQDPGFLTMREYGPFDTLDASDVRYLGRYVMALTLRASHLETLQNPLNYITPDASRHKTPPPAPFRKGERKPLQEPTSLSVARPMGPPTNMAIRAGRPPSHDPFADQISGQQHRTPSRSSGAPHDLSNETTDRRPAYAAKWNMQNLQAYEKRPNPSNPSPGSKAPSPPYSLSRQPPNESRTGRTTNEGSPQSNYEYMISRVTGQYQPSTAAAHVDAAYQVESRSTSRPDQYGQKQDSQDRGTRRENPGFSNPVDPVREARHEGRGRARGRESTRQDTVGTRRETDLVKEAKKKGRRG